MLFAWSDTPYLAEIEHLRKGICRTFIPAAIVLCKYLPVLAQPIECRSSHALLRLRSLCL